MAGDPNSSEHDSLTVRVETTPTKRAARQSKAVKNDPKTPTTLTTAQQHLTPSSVKSGNGSVASPITLSSDDDHEEPSPTKSIKKRMSKAQLSPTASKRRSRQISKTSSVKPPPARLRPTKTDVAHGQLDSIAEEADESVQSNSPFHDASRPSSTSLGQSEKPSTRRPSNRRLDVKIKQETEDSEASDDQLHKKKKPFECCCAFCALHYTSHYLDGHRSTLPWPGLLECMGGGSKAQHYVDGFREAMGLARGTIPMPLRIIVTPFMKQVRERAQQVVSTYPESSDDDSL